MPERVVIVGAGPAGLAVAGSLKQLGVGALVLDAAPHVGSAWRKHYDRLHLHTHKGGSALPGLAFPSEYPRYPSRQQVVDYLEGYARHFEIDLALGEAVTRIEPEGSGWAVATSRRKRVSEQVVIATGYTRVPLRPTWPGLEGFRGEVLHSSSYKNGAAWKGKRVLVVGLGNSGGEIGIDLHEHGALPTISVRSALNVIPRELLGLPILLWGTVLRSFPGKVADRMAAPLLAFSIGDLTRLGLRKKPYGAMEQIQRDGRIPLIDVGTLALVREGHVKIVPGIQHFTEASAVFEGGAAQAFDAVVLATGYRPGLEDFLPLARELWGERGVPTTAGEARPGLHLCGFHVSTRGMLKEIGIEARQIAGDVATALARRAS